MVNTAPGHLMPFVFLEWRSDKSLIITSAKGTMFQACSVCLSVLSVHLFACLLAGLGENSLISMKTGETLAKEEPIKFWNGPR